MLALKIRAGYPVDKNSLKLTTKQQIQLALNGYAYLGMAQPVGYIAPDRIYIVRCPKHGYYLDTVHGIKQSTFYCQTCIAETKHQTEGKQVERCRGSSFSNMKPSNSYFSYPLHPTNPTTGA